MQMKKKSKKEKLKTKYPRIRVNHHAN